MLCLKCIARLIAALSSGYVIARIDIVVLAVQVGKFMKEKQIPPFLRSGFFVVEDNSVVVSVGNCINRSIFCGEENKFDGGQLMEINNVSANVFEFPFQRVFKHIP